MKGNVVKAVQRAIPIPRREHVIPALQIAQCVLLQTTVSTAPHPTTLKTGPASNWSVHSVSCIITSRMFSIAYLAFSMFLFCDVKILVTFFWNVSEVYWKILLKIELAVELYVQY